MTFRRGLVRSSSVGGRRDRIGAARQSQNEPRSDARIAPPRAPAVCTTPPAHGATHLPRPQYALDLDAYFRTNQTCAGGAPCWVQIIGNGVAGMPSPRNSFAWETYGAGLILYGGFYHNIQASGPFTDCSPAAQW